MNVVRGPAKPLFVATILAGSFLLFMVQPMVARLALPRLGGAPNVWNSAMLVYQVLLLAGYWYAHRLSRQPLARQAKLHIALCIAAMISLPVALVDLPDPTPGSEALWVPVLLALSIGPVFFLVSAQAPLMQRWYAAHPEAGEPWALYAASNIGSFAGLLAYPLVVEPLLSTSVQSWAWSGGYVLLLGLVATCALTRRNLPSNPATVAVAAPIPARRTAFWIVLAAVPSGLMLSTTTHLTTDIFAMPLLWVIPLGLYLVSFVFAFSENRIAARVLSILAWPVLFLVGGHAMISQGSVGLQPVLASVTLLFFVCTALHARLYELRPEPEQLTSFYLAMSIGGALGGLFTALIAPLVFDWVWEHPLLLLAAAGLLPLDRLLDWTRVGGLQPGLKRLALVSTLMTAIVLEWMVYQANQVSGRESEALMLTIVICVTGMILLSWRWAIIALLTGAMLAQGGWQTLEDSRAGIRIRSYFGVYTIRDYPERKLRTLAHGTTLHGQQSTDSASRCLPMSYYGPGSGVGIGFANSSKLVGARQRLGVVGLGTGSLAAYARPGQSWTMFEIDQAVLGLSQRGTFTYLRDCAPQAKVVLGDARLALAKIRPGSFDLLAIDAFSSDSVPMHLLTREAFGIYMQALDPQGILFVHISNRYIDLEPPIAAEVRARGLSAAMRVDVPPEDSPWTGSNWIAISRNPEKIAALAASAPAHEWRPLGKPAARAWTDDHASILPYVTWSNFLGKP